MAKNTEKLTDLQVTFVDLEAGAQAPRFAAYRINAAGRPVSKLGVYDGQRLSLDLGEARTIALGPDVEDFTALPAENLVRYRVAQKLDLWRSQGVVLPRDIWDRFHFVFFCVTGTVSKCRPWYWDLLDDVRLAPMFERAQIARIRPLAFELKPHLLFPPRCQHICDGIVEVYERECCCDYIYIPDLLERLRAILDILPIPLPDPIPEPIPGPDPAPFTPQLLRATARRIQQRNAPLDLGAIPPQNLHQDYLTLRTLPADEARRYVLERPYLFPIFCNCSVRKVGETPIQPSGHFDFCYRRAPDYHRHRNCVTTYAYKVKQLLNGVWTVVYDGLAAHEYFAADDSADIQTSNTHARTCADGPGEPPPNDGQPFVMLEHIGQHGTFHFNFPSQTGLSQVGSLDPNDGTYTTDYAADCPWGGALGLRLWFSPGLEPIVKYYRLKVVAVNDTGTPLGTVTVLKDSVTWDKYVTSASGVTVEPETLGPTSAGTETNLFKVPYWSEHDYLDGQFHQVWNTAALGEFPDGKYMLILEVFNAAGQRIMPNGATGTPTDIGQNFQFRRWTSVTNTANIPFADAAHIFWVDNTPVGGDLVDLRQDGIANAAECQFMSQPKNTTSTFAIGFRAYHVHGVEHTGLNDHNSFMLSYGISWQRGLNGAIGSLGPAPSGGDNHTDVGETGDAVSSGSETFANMLGAHAKCTFSVTLNVHAKHFTGTGRIDAYDYHETAAFALEV